MSCVTFEQQDFTSLSDHRLENLARFEPRSAGRTAALLFQSFWREGLLEGCEQTWEGETVTLSRAGAVLKLKARPVCGGDRIILPRDQSFGELNTLLETLRVLTGLNPDKAWNALTEEMIQSSMTQAAAYAVAEYREEPKDYLDFEAWTPEGHNLHPGAKTRAGFSAADQMSYAPELTDTVTLPWLAVRRELLTQSGIVEDVFQLDEQHWAVPVHPWQLKRTLERVYSEEFARGEIRLLLDREPLECRPCTSLRTLVPNDTSFPVLKTSVGCLMTSTDRSMSRYTVLQGPVYSEYLQRIFKTEPELADRGVAMAEPGGLCWSDPKDKTRARNLSLLFRQRPPSTESTVPVPCSTLTQPVWGDDSRTYISRLFGQGAGAATNFRRYLELVVPFHLKLYLRWGLALEAHLQNCVVEWSPEGPERLWVRDWGGLRADAQTLSRTAPDLLEKLDPRSVSLSDAEAAEKKLIACLYCNHVTEIVAGLVREFRLDEVTLWDEVAHVSASVLDLYRGSTLAARVMRDEWPVKCLLTMRLDTADRGDLYRMRTNPLNR